MAECSSAGLHWEGLDGSNTALSHLGTAVRLAQGMGCHRPATTRKLKGQPFLAKPSSSSSPRQLALLRRIWHSAVAIDRFTAVTEGVNTIMLVSVHELASPLLKLVVL